MKTEAINRLYVATSRLPKLIRRLAIVADANYCSAAHGCRSLTEHLRRVAARHDVSLRTARRLHNIYPQRGIQGLIPRR